ncbi:hypothetical protein COB64_03175 [Candidatus Wolfebacteria bacterium]|nr:MAG: hypothetical protein COB64_03175 [Candidatus Wolfebacteria bacterium]
MKIIIQWLILTLAIIAVAYFLPAISISGIAAALIVGAILTFVNLIIKPIIKIITLPINIVTFGLFALILNGLIFWFVGTIINGFNVATIQTAIIGAIVVSILTWIGNKVLN